MMDPMERAEIITSTANPRVKRLASWKDRKARDRDGVFLVEGTREVARLLGSGHAAREIVVMDDGRADDTRAIADVADLAALVALVDLAVERGAAVTRLGPDAFARIAYRERPEGIVAVVDQWPLGLGEVIRALPNDPLLLIVDQVEKPGNLGTLLRSADAAGAHGVIVCDPVVDVFNSNVIRNSTGVLFWMPIAVAPAAEVREVLRAQNIAIVATTPDGDHGLWDSELAGRVAVVLGAEHEGLPDAWLDVADIRLRIPMHGGADSLNVAMAATLVLYEARRQRLLYGR